VLAIIVAALTALTPLGVGQNSTAPFGFDGGGGPDPYGYKYLDSDTTCPGAPTYTWREIKGVGTRVTGLGDDNVIGPFPVGFDFPYYWYKVNVIYVGSNGYIAFHDNALDASPFQHIPDPTRPNNTLAALMSDLDCSAGGSVWYWGSADSFIVEYDCCQFWNTGGNNSFQIILVKADSSIVFQYKEQSGQPYNGWAPDNNQTGIENVSGSVGLSYLSGTTPSQNMYHPALAVRFFPPDSTNYQVHDAGVRNAMNDRNGGSFFLNTKPVTFWAVIKNFGNQPEAAFKAYARVKRSSGSVVYFDSMQASVPNPGDIDSIVFPNVWTPSSNGAYLTEVIAKLTGDVLPTNDTAKVETRVVTLPGTLSYDKGTPDAFYSWNGPGGYGARFVPPVYPCSITSIKFMAGSQNGVTCAFGLFDDNGPGGSPGDTFFIQDVNVSTQNWYTVNLSTPAVIADGAFFVGAMSSVTSDPSFGMDTIMPMSGQSWEYTGVWAPSRDAWLREAMFNAMVTATGISEWIGPTPVPAPVRILANPNPFGTQTQLRLANPRGSETALVVYDAAGNLVRSLELARGRATLDAKGLSEGIYFAQLDGSETPVTKLVVCR